MGHSAGGVFTQILLDHGFGAAGVAIDSAPTEGVKRMPLSQVRASFPVLKNPANRHRAVGLTHEQWHYTFTNGFSDEESLRLYERYHVPASGAIFWGSALANIHPGKDDTWVNYDNPDRAPLLFISGSDDHLMPPSIQRSNAKHYKAPGLVTEVANDGHAPAEGPLPPGRCHCRTLSMEPFGARLRGGCRDGAALAIARTGCRAARAVDLYANGPPLRRARPIQRWSKGVSPKPRSSATGSTPRRSPSLRPPARCPMAGGAHHAAWSAAGCARSLTWSSVSTAGPG